MKKLKIILLIIILAVMGLIFKFSSQTADISDALSESVTTKIVNILPDTKALPETEKQKLVTEWNSKIREYAHFIMFAILGFFCFLLIVSAFGTKTLNGWLITVILCLIYAISDEIHQIWVPERGAEVRDVCIDFLGAILGSGIGVIVFTSVKAIIYKRRKL